MTTANILIYSVSFFMVVSCGLFTYDILKRPTSGNREAYRLEVPVRSEMSKAKKIRKKIGPDQRGLIYSALGLILYLSYYGDVAFGIIGSGLRYLWSWTSEVGGNPDFDSAIYLAALLFLLYAIRATIAFLARRDISPLSSAIDLTLLNARIAPVLSAINAILILFFLVVAIFELAWFGIVATAVVFVLAIVFYLSNILPDATAIIINWIHRQIILGFWPALIKYLLFVWKTVRLALKVPNPLEARRLKSEELLDEAAQTDEPLEGAIRSAAAAVALEEQEIAEENMKKED